MVTRPEPAAPLDALILVPPGSLSDFAEDLGAELVRLGLRVKVRSVRSSADSPLKQAVSEDADQARLCVVLGIVTRQAVRNALSWPHEGELRQHATT